MEDSPKVCFFVCIPIKNSSFCFSFFEKPRLTTEVRERPGANLATLLFCLDPPGVGLNGDPAERLISVCETGGGLNEKHTQPMVSWWFALSNNLFHKEVSDIQTTGPQTTNIPLVDILNTQQKPTSEEFFGFL